MFPRFKARSKFGAVKTEVNGVKFASKAEAERYKTLLEAQARGIISGLELQPRFTLLDKFECRGEKIRAIEYVADFRYALPGREVVEDVKGMILPEFKLKLKLWKRLFGESYEFRIVKGMKEIRSFPS